MIVVFIIGLFTNIEALNPNYEKYEQAFESYKALIAESENTNNSQTVKQATNVMYDLNKYSVSTSIINVVVMVLYFGLFQYYLPIIRKSLKEKKYRLRHQYFLF